MFIKILSRSFIDDDKKFKTKKLNDEIKEVKNFYKRYLNTHSNIDLRG